MKCERCHEEAGQLQKHEIGEDLCPTCYAMECPTTCDECNAVYDCADMVVEHSGGGFLCEECAEKQRRIDISDEQMHYDMGVANWWETYADPSSLVHEEIKRQLSLGWSDEAILADLIKCVQGQFKVWADEPTCRNGLYLDLTVEGTAQALFDHYTEEIRVHGI